MFGRGGGCWLSCYRYRKGCILAQKLEVVERKRKAGWIGPREVFVWGGFGGRSECCESIEVAVLLEKRFGKEMSATLDFGGTERKEKD